MPNTIQPSAMIAPCDDCGNPTAVLNVNTPGNPYMLCGKCQYAHLGDIDAGQEWNSSDGVLGLTILNDRLWIMGHGLRDFCNVPAVNTAELITALQVAQARQAAAQKGSK